ncbi:TetR/AcrR family transcriptional regulator; helix-turn-helix transcriptional regulator [Streptacidiphilus sp. ASG 303]|uniref:TetR/AcrR family transcriptional regulator n=1 Tax=Streptacidiphilus sp. ASG 303 TaxID=2896847 RepID=UPI001E360BB7|nr:TetR/AcrR family transcriptional regulator [Streptacidiphilus sp. ASG 303]MCD0484245.1 TetR/AcrR family transcriptional regulator; helix-turn-helix transcriptional regulator [Streptacidiphilus sp. ASG 303]
MEADGRSAAPLRRDARRNRERLTAAAAEVFAEQGLDAPLDEIARRAGVGNATLYRHFPDRAALVGAVFRGVLADTARAGEEARRSEDAWAGLTAYLERIFAGLAADRGANDLMTTGIPGVAALEVLHAENRETVSLLAARAQAQGAMRDDVNAEDLLFSFAALGRAVPALTAAAPDAWRRYLALLLDGLRAGGPVPLPGTPLTRDGLGAVLRDLGPHRSA